MCCAGEFAIGELPLLLVDGYNVIGLWPRLKKRFGIAPRGSLQEIVEHLQEKMDDDVQEMIDDMSEENDSKRGRVAMRESECIRDALIGGRLDPLIAVAEPQRAGQVTGILLEMQDADPLVGL